MPTIFYGHDYESRSLEKWGTPWRVKGHANATQIVVDIYMISPMKMDSKKFAQSRSLTQLYAYTQAASSRHPHVTVRMNSI